MPAMKIFGRQWRVSTDDFVYPMAGEIPFRVIWLVIFAAVLGTQLIYRDCYEPDLLMTYFVGMVVILGLVALLDAAILYTSMQGTIMDEGRERRHVPTMLVVKLFLFLVEVTWVAIGTSWAYPIDTDPYIPCSITPRIVSTVRGTSIVGWVLVCLHIVCICLVFDPWGRPSTRLPEDEQATRQWRIRCKLLCCCVACKNDVRTSGTFDELSKLLAEFFQGSNFVTTDIAAGLVLVRHDQERKWIVQQRQDLETKKGQDGKQEFDSSQTFRLISSIHIGSNSDEPGLPDWMNLRMAEHVMKFAAGVYGWPFFVFDNLISGPCKLCLTCRCCSCCRHQDSEILGDNCCQCNTSAILQQTKIQRNDILYANYHNKLYETPFFIAFDHEEKLIIITIRGTLSLYDALTDATLEAEDVSIDGIPDAKAHKGILQAARYVQKMIQELGLLDVAFVRNPGYRLMVTGHSLGAGAAAVLAILLKSSYPDLICFAFSPPGWLISESLRSFSEQFICSIVVGKDLVPRLGMITLNKLKSDVVAAIKNCRRPKHRILTSAMTKTVCNSYCVGEDYFEAVSPGTDLINGTSSQGAQESPRVDNVDPEIENPQIKNLLENPLYLPGRIIYLEKLSAKGAAYKAYWEKPDRFQKILVGPEMVIDHIPNVVYRAIFSALTNQESLT